MNLPASAGSNKCVIMQAKRAHIASLRARNACSNATDRGRLRCRHRLPCCDISWQIKLATAADAIKASSGCQQWMATLCCRATTSASNCASRGWLCCDRATLEQSIERQGYKSKLTCGAVSNNASQQETPPAMHHAALQKIEPADATNASKASRHRSNENQQAWQQQYRQWPTPLLPSETPCCTAPPPCDKSNSPPPPMQAKRVAVGQRP